MLAYVREIARTGGRMVGVPSVCLLLLADPGGAQAGCLLHCGLQKLSEMSASGRDQEQSQAARECPKHRVLLQPGGD